MMRASALVLALVAIGCGTNRPDIPDKYLQFDGGSTANYPSGPYGSAKGDIAENLTFTQGWMNPAAVNYDVAQLAPISFADFYDPTGETYEILLVNTSAIWCSACKIEHETLNGHVAELGPKGFTILSLLFEDASNNPADVNNLVTWTQTFETAFPMALDPEYQMKTFQPNKALAPFNMVIDCRTMTILETYVGDQAGTMWPFITAELDKRTASGG